MACHEPLSHPDFCSIPWVINFSKTKAEEPRTTFVNPFDGCFFEGRLPMIEGKQCLRCFGDWLLVFYDGTQECFLVNITSCSKISLPPLLHPIDSLGTCALSSPTPPNCTVMFACSRDGRFVLHCRLGDQEWTKHDIDFQDDREDFVGTIFGSKGKMYVNTTYNGQCVIINTTSGSCVEKMGVADPDTCPLYHPCASFWVESDGDIFLVRFYLHSYQGLGVTNIDIHRMDTSNYVWRRVENIGGATFFLGRNCVAVSSLAAGTKANCIYLLLWSCDGMRLYSIRLDDWTMSFSLLPAFTEDLQNLSSCEDIWSKTYWAIPQRFRQEPTKYLGGSSSEFRRSILSMEDEEQLASLWSGLPVELIELLVPKLSFVDYYHIRAVCKGWNLIGRSIQHAKIHPMLMSVYGRSGNLCRLFDPMVEKQYIAKDIMLSDGNWQTLHFSKCGWVLLTKGKRCICAVNPFSREVFKLPKMRHHLFNGIAFSSAPKCPDFVVLAIHKDPWQDSVDVMLWRDGDKRWTNYELPCDTPFSMTTNNPVFFDNEFYFLGVHGNLGVFNPDEVTWRVLDKPERVRDGAHDYGDRYCYLVEFKGDLIAIFRPYDASPIEMFKLDRSDMSWTKVLRLDDAVLFLDNWNAIIRSSLEYGCCNRIYLPFVDYKEAEDQRVSVFYDLEDGKYKPELYGVTEPINCIWVEPNFNGHL
ncbi:unnamed protein product [Urochloa decumbens]|uniref:KIB1-4 beta-propeller domain-containing protein n=1 Tax=Urochloa decumbens TaxID=240449 RepID=A0ABC8XIR4_9POAL